jgi:endonuclease YncB( thermonuclease family)
LQVLTLRTRRLDRQTDEYNPIACCNQNERTGVTRRVTHDLSFPPAHHWRPEPRLGGVLPIVGLIFGLGLGVGALVRQPPPPVHSAAAWTDRPFSAWKHGAAAFDPQRIYAAEVLRVIDGDTFWARVRVWPGLDVDTKVRLRAIDAPELHARCAREFLQAEAARTALARILSAGGVTISQIGQDKYRGRIDATVTTRDTADVSTALLKGGFARSYGGGRRGTWC